MTVPLRIVLDTNVLLRALINPDSSSGQLVEACEARRAIALLSKPLMREYRIVLERAASEKSIPRESIAGVLNELMYFGHYLPRVVSRFAYPRDMTDEKLIELAIDAGATHISSYDLDLLALPSARSDAGKRFRQRLHGVVVARPNALLKIHPRLVGKSG